MKQILRTAAGAAALFLCLLAAGCGTKASSPAAESFKVVTSFYPVYVLTLNVTAGAEGVEVVNMASPDTGCLHDYQLTTSDMKALDGADVLVVNGAGMERFLDKVTEQMPALQVITATEGMELIEETHDLHMEEFAYNPHVWVSPEKAAEEVLNIAAGLAEADPANAERYSANAADFAAELKTLQADMSTRLAALPNRKLVTFHEAFPYFAEAFGFETAAVVENEPGQEPSAAELDALIRLIRQEQIPAIFVESQYADRSARLIAEETGAQVYTLELMVSGPEELTPEEAHDAYLRAMEENEAVLMEALK